MELGPYLLFLAIFVVAGGVAAGAIVWALLHPTVRQLRLQVAASKEAERAAVGELAKARQEAEVWRERHQAEQLDRTRFETEARRIVALEPELRRALIRVETAGAEKSALQVVAERVPGLDRSVQALTDDIVALKTRNAELMTELREQQEAHTQRVEALTKVRGEIERELKTIAADALRANQGTFLQLANEVFEKHKAGAEAELDARRQAVNELVGPLLQSLDNVKRQVDELEKSRAQSFGALAAELKGVVAAQNAVRAETSKLANALRAAPKTRGRWGEQTLRNVLELAGLSEHCDFATEQTFAVNGGVARPDVVIRLPGGRCIVVDAKTSLSAYLDAVEATEESERDRQLQLHAAQIRAHARQLAGKPYRDLVPAPDFVVMFVPGDNFYAAAAERDPSLFEDAAAQGVLIVTPATLIALAKAVAFGWRQQKVAENALRVQELGRDLYRRMLAMAGHIDRCGDALGTSVRHFNQLVGSLEHSVLPQARRFRELGVEGTTTELAPLGQVELEPRSLRLDRDLDDSDMASSETRSCDESLVGAG
jgi:DNA recombination protein RmuC